MANVKELQEELRALKDMLASYGYEAPLPIATDAKDRADYIEFGSDEHAVFLGLVPAKPGDEDRITRTSPRTGKTFALEDEVTQFMNYPDPAQVAALVLQQKINELETKPEVPADAKPMKTMGLPV